MIKPREIIHVKEICSRMEYSQPALQLLVTPKLGRLSAMWRVVTRNVGYVPVSPVNNKQFVLRLVPRENKPYSWYTRTVNTQDVWKRIWVSIGKWKFKFKYNFCFTILLPLRSTSSTLQSCGNDLNRTVPYLWPLWRADKKNMTVVAFCLARMSGKNNKLYWT